MTTTGNSVDAQGRLGIDWRRAEFVLPLFGFVGFVTALIKIRTVYDGLPAHPLIVHVPVVLIPLSILGALACLARPAWLARYGILLCLTAIVAMSSIFLAMRAGTALQENVLHIDRGRLGQLVDEHAQAADVLAFVFVAFTASLILSFSATRISGEMGPTGLALIDRILSARLSLLVSRGLLVVLAVAAAISVFRVGDLGAKAVWQARIQAAQALTTRPGR